jgi:2-amino-4-hydroxy-6-hydroxymethyldihydropteridine diphosphokinase
MNVAYLLTGGNIGDRLYFLYRAKEVIEKECGIIQKMSAIYETEAWGLEDQNSFYNQALLLQTHLNAEDLLHRLLQIEATLGRKREYKYGPRVIDIDIIFFNDEVIRSKELTIPHPQMQNRRFVLLPLNEIAPHKVHPEFKKTISELLDECKDQLEVVKLQ